MVKTTDTRSSQTPDSEFWREEDRKFDARFDEVIMEVDEGLEHDLHDILVRLRADRELSKASMVVLREGMRKLVGKLDELIGDGP